MTLRLKRKLAFAIVALMLVSAIAPAIGPAMAQGDDDVLRIAMQEDMPNFNTFDLASNSVWKDYVLGRWIYDSLSGLDPGGNLFPQLAQGWDFDLENLTVDLTLREGVKWHDGEDLTADDIVFTYMSIRSATTYSSNIINAFDADGDGDCSADEMDGTVDADTDGTFEGITKVDDHNVTFVMAKPYGQFFLQTLGVPIIPEHIWASHLDSEGIVDVQWTEDQDAAIGSGPFYYHSGEPDVFRRLVKFEDYNGGSYWGMQFKTPSDHYIYPQEADEIYFTLYSTLDTAILALKSGLVDHVPWTVTPGYVPDLISNPRTDIETIADNGYFYLAFNMKKVPMNYMAFRQAVSHVIDKATIVDRYMGGFGQPGDSSEPPFWEDWYNSSVKHYDFSVAEAKSVLEAGGFTGVGTSNIKMPNGKAVPTLVLLTPPADYDPIRIKAGELIAKNLRELGIDIVAKPVDFDTLVAKMNAFDFDMLIIGWSLSSDPIGNVFDILGPLASQNTFGFWSDTNVNPFYEDVLGVSTLADAQTMAYADKVQELSDLATASFDRNEQIMYTKWAQGILAEALPVNVLYYRVNNYPVLDTWEGWIPYFGELLNVYSLGALTKGVVVPPSGEVIAILNLPDKLPMGMDVAGSVLVINEVGEPIAGADVTMTGDGTVTPASGMTDAGGLFTFTVSSSNTGWISVNAEATDGTTTFDTARFMNVVPGVPKMVHLQVMPDDLFLGAGESTAVNLLVTDEDGMGVEGVVVELEEGLLGYGSIDPSEPAEVTTDVDGMAIMTYTAPDPIPTNKHIEVRLSISPKVMDPYTTENVNTVTQFLVLRNMEPSMWHFAQVTGATQWATNNTSASTDISVKTFDENGDATSETLDIFYSNPDVLVNPPSSVTTDASGDGMVTIEFMDGETTATQVFFENLEVSNAVGAGANILFNGNTTPPANFYGGYFSIAGVPMLDPDAGENLTFDIYLYDVDGEMAMGDVPVSFIVGQPTDGSTAAMVDAPDYMWTSLWDYTGINVFTDSDNGALASGGWFLSNKMSDAQIEAMDGLYTSEEDFFNDWFGGPVDELVNMTAMVVTDGHAQVTIEQDVAVLSDNIPNLIVVPGGVAGFYVTGPSYSNYWWEIQGTTAWKTEFLMQRTDTIYSVMYDMPSGILRDFAPGNTSDVVVTVYDQDNMPVEGMATEGFVQVYGGSSFFDIADPEVTDENGMTTITVTGMTASGGGPLSNPAKQPLYLQALPDYGWSVFTSIEIYDVPVQLYLDLDVTPILSPSGAITDAIVTAHVIDETGEDVQDLTVEFTVEDGSLSDASATTDASGMGSVTYTLPDVPAGDDFIIAAVKSSVLQEGYGAATAEFNLVSALFDNLAPTISDTSIPATGYETEATTWSITGMATDDWGIKLVTGSLDGGDPVVMGLTADEWTFEMTGLTVAEHTVVITVEDLWGLTATETLVFTVNEPTVVNEPPEFSDINIAETGYEINEGLDVTFSGKAIDAIGISTIKYTLDGGAEVDVAFTGEDWSFDLADLAVGNHTVNITVTDTFGETDTYSSTFEVLEVTSNTPPEISDVNIPLIGFTTKKSKVTISGKAVDAEGISKVEIKVDSGDPVELTLDGDDWTYDITGLKTGVYTVTVTVTDTFDETDDYVAIITVLKEDVEDEVNTMLWVGIIVIIIIVVLVAMMMMRGGGGEPAAAAPAYEPEETGGEEVEEEEEEEVEEEE
jgi:ABC-type transport system substrate-binding protein